MRGVAHRTMTAMEYEEALALAAEAVDDPDDFIDVVSALLALRWSDGLPVVNRGAPFAGP